MRGTLQYFLFSGIAWFAAGAAYLAVALLPKRDFERAGRVILLITVGIGALSGTPLPWWMAIPLVAVTLAYPFAMGKRWLAIAAAVMVAAAIGHEARFFLVSPLREPPEKIVVIGDSLSSGGFGEETPWPELLAIPAVNFSQPSETVATALEYGLPVASDGSLAVVAIGGNDMLGGTPAWEFARDLDLLLRRLGGVRVVMFELPVLPGKWSFAAAQRRLARKHNVTLIPRRMLLRVLTTRGSTTDDGLHLTQEGHHRMAAAVGRALGTRARRNR